MKHLAVLLPLLLVALACTPVYGVWTYVEGQDYFSLAATRGRALNELPPNGPQPASSNRPDRSAPREQQRFPMAVGATCSPEQLAVIAAAWNEAIRIAAVAEVRHLAQKQGGVFSPNEPFMAFIERGNYKVLAREPQGPEMLFDVLSAMFVRIKEAFGMRWDLEDGTGKGLGLPVTCYSHYWVFDGANSVYRDGCESALAFVVYFEYQAPFETPVYRQFMNFCKDLFKTNTVSYATFVDDLLKDPYEEDRELSVDYWEDTKVSQILHEWMHVESILWRNAADIVYSAKYCRRLTEAHHTMTMNPQRGGGLISAGLTPPNADSLAMYMFALAMDSHDGIRAEFGYGINDQRTSSATADPYFDATSSSESDATAAARQALQARYQTYWDGVSWNNAPAYPPNPDNNINMPIPIV